LLKTGQRKRSPIGVDIGAAGVRAVQLTRSGDEYVVSASVQVDRNRGEAVGEENAGKIARRIADCVSKARFRGRAAVVSLSSPDVEFHALDLPAAVFKSGEENRERIIHSEVERLMSDVGGGVETRHWLLPGSPAGQSPAPSAIGLGARSEVVGRMISSCDGAGLDCRSVEASAIALCRFGAVLRRWGPESTWGVLDVGDRQTRLVLCRDGTPVLVRPTGSGSRAWTQRIAETLNLSPKAAEIHKREYGVAVSGRNAARDDSDAVRTGLPAILLGALRRDLNDLAAEIKRSYEYILRCFPGQKAGDLVLTGSGSLLGSLPEFLGNALGIPVRRPSTYLEAGECRLIYRSGHHEPLETFAAAVGLALGD